MYYEHRISQGPVLYRSEFNIKIKIVHFINPTQKY
jgi:hypothetical protein